MTQPKELDLRDWFAGQVLGGMLANPHYPAQSPGEALDQYISRITDSAYRIGDAMAKRSQKAKMNTPNGRVDGGSALDGLR